MTDDSPGLGCCTMPIKTLHSGHGELLQIQLWQFSSSPEKGTKEVFIVQMHSKTQYPIWGMLRDVIIEYFLNIACISRYAFDILLGVPIFGEVIR